LKRVEAELKKVEREILDITPKSPDANSSISWPVGEFLWEMD
jgi:hypothetical protein